MNTQNEALLIGKTEKGATAQKIGETAVNNPKTAIELKIEKFKPKNPTAEERIELISHFEAQAKRFKILKEKANNLKMFEAGNDKTSSKIVLKNSVGFEFEVHNSNVIEKVTKTMREELNILLLESENEILTFQI